MCAYLGKGNLKVVCIYPYCYSYYIIVLSESIFKLAVIYLLSVLVLKYFIQGISYNYEVATVANTSIILQCLCIPTL